MTTNLPSRPRPARRLRWSLLTLAAAAGMAVPACDRTSATADAVIKASNELAALTPGGTAPASSSFKLVKYTEVIKLLQPHATAGSPGENAAAAVLISQAQLGLAEPVAAEAGGIESAALNAQTLVAAALSQWLSHNAMAASAAKFDPAPEIAEIDRQVQDRQAEIKAQTAQRAAVDAKVADLRARSASKAAEAKAKRADEARLVQKIADVSAVQGEELLKQARQIKRLGDALEVEASDLDAAAAQIAPESDEILLNIDKAKKQVTLLADARAEVDRRTAAAKAQAQTALAAAGEAAKAVADQVEALVALRSGPAKAESTRPLNDAIADAVAKYATAAKTAKGAASDANSKGTAQVSVGTAEQCIGDLHWTHAKGLDALAQMFDTLASAQPPLPDAAQFKAMAEEARTQRSAAAQAATEAYQAAHGAFKAAGGRGDAAARLDAVVAKLADAVYTTSDSETDIREAPAPVGEAPADEPATDVAQGDPNSPGAAFQSFLDLVKAQEFTQLADFIYTQSDQEKSQLRTILASSAKMKRLDDACKAKFGKGFAEAALEMQQAGGAQGGPTVPTGGLDLNKLEGISASDVTFTESGDTADGVLPDGKGAVKLKQADGRWLVDMTSMGLNSQTLAMAASIMPVLTKAVDDLIPEVEAGKYPNMQAVFMALTQKMMGGLKPPGGGGGGG